METGVKNPEWGDYNLRLKKPINSETASLVALKTAPQGSPLYEGIDNYKNMIHRERIELYQDKYGLGIVPEKPSETYFRDKFQKFILEMENKKPNPIPTQYEAPIKMEDFFEQSGKGEGKKYAELYELALEEEMNSANFMDAVLHASTEIYTGEKWTERPIVFVGGPSASGKSFAANSAIKKTTEFLSKEAGPNENGNKVTFVDGGIARKVSQVRKLALKAAGNHGYAGIKDLNSHSQVLRKVKRKVYNHAMDVDKECGIVIPETFSAFVKPGDKSRQMLKDAMNVTNARVIFTRTKGKNPDIFQKVVQFMGSSRAWNKGNVEQHDLANLNKKTASESKAYGAGGFRWGAIGSKLAEVWFKHNCKENLSMVIINDLVLKKQSDPKNPYQYEDAMPQDKNAFMVSQRVYDNWIAAMETKKVSEPLISLTDYMNDPANQVGSLIYTSAEVKVEIAKNNLNTIIQSETENSYKSSLLIKIAASLKNADNLKNTDQISQLQKQVQPLLSIYKQEKQFGISNTYDKIEKLSKALTKLSKELSHQNKAGVEIEVEPDKSSTHKMMWMQSSPDVEAKQPLSIGSHRAEAPKLSTQRPSIEGSIKVEKKDELKMLSKSLEYALGRYRDAYAGKLNKLTGRGPSEHGKDDLKKFIEILHNPTISTANDLKKEINIVLKDIPNESRLKDYVTRVLKMYDLSVQKTFAETPEAATPRMK